MTLVELMIVVAIIGVLATLAVFMFSKQTKKAQYDSEVAAMFGEFRTRQEAYFLENDTYLSTGPESTMHPATPASGTTTANAIQPQPASWDALRMNSGKDRVYCSYVAVAGAASDGSNVGTVAATDFAFVAPPTSWYYLLAQCDGDANSTIDHYYFASSDVEGTRQLNSGN